MLQHQVRVMTSNNDKDVQHISVRRKYLLKDALRAFSKPNFNVSKYLRMRFIGESAHDDGGRRREFFRFILSLIGESSLFAGWPANVVPVHNVHAVAANEYYVIGKILAMSLVQGGQPPVFCSRSCRLHT